MSKIDLQYEVPKDFVNLMADDLLPIHMRPSSLELRTKVANIATKYLSERKSKLPATEAGLWELRIHLWSILDENSSNT